VTVLAVGLGARAQKRRGQLRKRQSQPFGALLSIAVLEDVPDVKALGAFVPNREQLRAAERETKRICKDPHKRRRFLSHVRSDASVIRSALATLEALLEHSDDSGSPVWPSQARLARLAHVDVRTVQRHLKELREAGYLLVFVYGANRDETTGRYRRRKTNRYYFTFCKTPGNGHRVRRNRTSHLHDTDDVSNPLGMSNPRPEGRGGESLGLVIEGINDRVPPAPTPPPPGGTWSDQKGCELCDFTQFIFDESGCATHCTCY
jgi:hypothetical protein